jgi:serine phosphatase RsbU (regulator of sigma subunit)
MLLYSDGITEAKKMVKNEVSPELFGEKLLGKLFRESAIFPVEVVKNTILKELLNYKCDDDVTMVILKRKA